MDPKIERLLDLQEKDTRVLALESQAGAIPKERKNILAHIEEEKQHLEALVNTVKQQELERKKREGEIAAAEEKILQYKNQQLSVKKNEEYNALNQQIEGLQRQIDALEDSVLSLLEEVDVSAQIVSDEEQRVALRMQEFEGELAALTAKEQLLQRELKLAREQLAAVMENISEQELVLFRRVRARVRRGAAIVPLLDHKCGGCFLRVDNETVSAARDTSIDALCSHCGRLLYLE